MHRGNQEVHPTKIIYYNRRFKHKSLNVADRENKIKQLYSINSKNENICNVYIYFNIESGSNIAYYLYDD